jgi:Nitrogen regulatory protein PII
MNLDSNIKALFIIVNAGYVNEVMETARKAGAMGGTVLKARGEGKHHEVFMGISVDSEKEMILCIVDEETADKIMIAQKEKSGIKTPAHSICFTMPIDKIIGTNMSSL